jgi:NAD(P)-dependent dehydrogenase (short-subunit alcohol dehydrogenase family)
VGPRFAGLTALVVGGTGGMGRATAARLAEEGGSVVVTGATGEEVDSYLAAAGGSAVPAAVLDVRDPGAVAGLIGRFDRLDVLVNLAGVGRGAAEHTEDGFERTVDVNLFGSMRTCYAARPLLERSRGCIVNTASVMSFLGSPTAPAYASSKGAVVQLTKSLAVAMGPLGIRVNAVVPGWIETPMTAALFTDEALVARVLARTPMQRFGQPEEVADAICFLASPTSTFITGATLAVDGGYLAG